MKESIDITALLTYICKNMETESAFLSIEPATHVEIIGLLDEIAKFRGISKDENGRQFNEILDKLENK